MKYELISGAMGRMAFSLRNYNQKNDFKYSFII